MEQEEMLSTAIWQRVKPKIYKDVAGLMHSIAKNKQKMEQKTWLCIS